MADEQKPKVAPEDSAPRPPRDRGAAGQPVRRPLPPPRTLTRAELEALRQRLRRQFH